MSTIPGHPLAAFIAGTASEGAIIPRPQTLSMLIDSDVILGRDMESEREFVVFGRDTLQRVADGEDDAGGYNILCILIDMTEGNGDLESLKQLLELVKGRHDYIDYVEEPGSTSDGKAAD